METEKIFGIGWPKTGTTSLEYAFGMLGYKVCNGYYNNNYTNFLIGLALNEDYDEIIRFTKLFDAFFDGPWGGTTLYKPLLREYPDAKFILSVRDPEKWYNSLIKMVTPHINNIETALDDMYEKTRYGFAMLVRRLFDITTLAGNKEKMIDIYKKYNQDAESYLRARNASLLVMDITENGGWKEICEFVGKPIPAKPFPHANRSAAA